MHTVKKFNPWLVTLHWLTALLVFLHIGAALYHQLSLRDNLLVRMGYGK